MALMEQDFTIDQGSSFILEFNLQDDANGFLPLTTSNSAIPGTSQIGRYTFRTKFRKSKYRGDVMFSLSTMNILQNATEDTRGRIADGFYVFAEHPGKVRMVISPATTSSMKYGKYFYDIEVVSGLAGSYEVIKALGGRMNINAEVTT
jgi:hypothetical protein